MNEESQEELEKLKLACINGIKFPVTNARVYQQHWANFGLLLMFGDENGFASSANKNHRLIYIVSELNKRYSELFQRSFSSKLNVPIFKDLTELFPNTKMSLGCLEYCVAIAISKTLMEYRLLSINSADAILELSNFLLDNSSRADLRNYLNSKGKSQVYEDIQNLLCLDLWRDTVSVDDFPINSAHLDLLHQTYLKAGGIHPIFGLQVLQAGLTELKSRSIYQVDDELRYLGHSKFKQRNAKSATNVKAIRYFYLIEIEGFSYQEIQEIENGQETGFNPRQKSKFEASASSLVSKGRKLLIPNIPEKNFDKKLEASSNIALRLIQNWSEVWPSIDDNLVTQLIDTYEGLSKYRT